MEIGEKLGTGLVQLFALWEQNGWPRPEFKEQFDPERTFLTLDYNDPEDNTPQKSGSHEQDNYDVNDGSGRENQASVIEDTQDGSEKTQKSSEKTSQRILNILTQDSMMTIAQLSSMLYISERAVSKQLRNLQFQGRLRRVGPDKGGHWEVLEKKQGPR